MDAYEVNERTNDLPYGVEYAKSGRSSCKKCHGTIGEGYVRMSAREPSRYFDGIQDNWFHLDCFFNKLGRGQINERSIRGLENLRWEDQERLRVRIHESQHNSPKSSSLASWSHFKVEHSRSNRGKCSKCSEKFALQEVKFCHKSSWYHQKCLFSGEQHSGEVSDLQGFDNLTEAAQELLKQELAPKVAYQSDDVPDTSSPRKRPADGEVVETTSASTSTCSQVAESENEKPTDFDSDDEEVPTMKKFCFDKYKEPAKKPEEDLKARLKKQTDVMWEIREKFQQNKMNRNDMIDLLEYNGQMNDIMRRKTEDQLLEHLVDCICFGKPIKCENCDTGLLVFSLSLRSYACIGYMSEFTRCINTQANPPRATFNIPSKTLKKYNFLDTVTFNVLSKRYYPGENEEVVKRRESNYFKNLGSRGATELFMESVKAGIDERGHSKKIIKFGTPVDSEFEHAHDCHVYREDGTLYSVTLHQTDVLMNTNSYYKMQLLKDDVKEVYYVFRSWGRVGTNVGGLKSDYYYKLKNAINAFTDLFLEKTGNAWENRKYFKKKPGMFALVEEDYSQLEQVKESRVAPGSTTKLHRSIKEIIMMISDLAKLNKEAANELHLDTTRMPLGKLSKQQITRAYSVLTQIQNILASDPNDMSAILDATNEFYTLVPHDFGMNNADILNNQDIIKRKCEMLDSLMDFQFAYDFLKKGEDESTISNRDPVDITYDKLRCKMEYLEESSSDFQLIEKYLKSSHGKTHATFSLQIIDVLKLKRDGEDEKFMSSMGNRKLLWHGSGVGNYVGILSQGLRIAPPEAPVSGYMFGRGVYFADMVSKSANYCRTHTEGLLLLCDVALGAMQEERHAININKPKAGFGSVKGVGQLHPVDKVYDHPDGFSIPLNGVNNADANVANNAYSLIYNEYIVYNVDQIQLRYLVRCRFKPSYR